MKIKTVLLLFIVSIFHFENLGQIALNGAVELKQYQGLQADLIEGVSALPANDNPLVRHIYLVDKNILALTIDEQAVNFNNLEPYKKQDGDTVLMKGYHGYSKVLERNGKQIAFLCGINNDWYRKFNTITGNKLDVDQASNPENYTITISGKKHKNKKIKPAKVYRKSYPARRNHVAQKNILGLRHEIYLVLPEEIKNGESYSIEFDKVGQLNNIVKFKFDESKLRSEAIHANLVGYQANEPKVAFVSTWMGDGGKLTYQRPLRFSLYNSQSKKYVYSGLSKLKSLGEEAEFSIGNKKFNYNLTDVHTLDFSDFNEVGKYKIVVHGIGCSFDFEIRNDIWEQFTKLNLKGFFHQRSGIEMGPPYTEYERPRNMHPEDEVTIHKCDVNKFFNIDVSGQQGVFKRIQASILTGTEVPEAWGGWMDAGDFDQRMSHLHSVHRMMYLYELNPEYFENLNLGIPESNNNIPDILDEALWCLDLYKRTQGVYEKGAVSWWIESVEHPRGGESSWLNSLPTALVPPTPGACYTYASCAAQMSVVLKKFNSGLSREYIQSALATMEWIQNNPDSPDIFYDNSPDVVKSMAFINLYRATGDKRWHLKFKESLYHVFPNGIESGISERNANILVNYLLNTQYELDSVIVENSERAILKLADELTDNANENTYNIFRTENKEIRRLVLPSKSILPVAFAHFISKDKKYTDALCQTIQYTMGANPMNRSYVSGLGDRWFTPYQLDFEISNSPAPSGIPNFGPTTQTENKWGWTGDWAIKMVEEQNLYPNKLTEWPFAEKCFNNIWIAPINEFTVAHPMGEMLMLTGYLAQSYSNIK